MASWFKQGDDGSSHNGPSPDLDAPLDPPLKTPPAAPRWARPEVRPVAVERLDSDVASAPTLGGAVTAETSQIFQEARARIHRQLLERLNLSSVANRERAELDEEIRKIVQQLLAKDEAPLNSEEKERLLREIMDDVFGLGPLQPLVDDPTISDILVNTCNQVMIERDGKIEATDVKFRDNQHLMQVIDRIVSAVGRRIDDSSPMVDARLADGSRVNAIIPPLALDGPHISIRKFRRDVLSAEDLIRNESFTDAMLKLMQGCIRARLNVLIAGGTGSGKTTILNMLSESIPHSERIVTIEDSAELQLRQPHVVRLETRPPNVEGVGAVAQRQLVINSLRMRPDRIILGEVRGEEALDMLQAMNTGHDGSITTVHANAPRDALARIETMVSMGNSQIRERAIRSQIASAIDLVIHLSRLSDGKRKVMAISELSGMEGEVITMQDLFIFERQGMDEDGNVLGRFKPTGVRPTFSDRLQAYGVDLGETLFVDPVSVGNRNARQR
jgi:pilus assembly protein CpaF